MSCLVFQKNAKLNRHSEVEFEKRNRESLSVRSGNAKQPTLRDIGAHGLLTLTRFLICENSPKVDFCQQR